MQRVADWLKKLGMSEYTQCFMKNGIDYSVLPVLTDQDLEKLGVLLGHRRKLLHAISTLEDLENSRPAGAVAVSAPLYSAERRQVTAMFADLVGSTALSARMDPEDLREVIAAYHKCADEIVHRLGGFVSQYLGDGIVVYFGYPQAHEDDAERAVCAGLELVEAVAGLKTRAPLQTRIGIATGLVVGGDMIDAGGSGEHSVFGETPNVAARLQGIAEPNQVIIAEGTRQLLGNLFELKRLGARDLKGIPEPVPAWAVLRIGSVEGRFEALHAAGLTALVGREEEIELLQRRWSRAKSGEGQVVLISGEAGIGKSRLSADLMERLAGEPHARLRYFCSQQHTDSAFHPIIGQMERAAGFAHGDTAQSRLDKLNSMLVSSTSPEDAALFAEMLSLPNDGRYPALELTPQQRRKRTLEALNLQIEVLSRQNPLLMIAEDAHWADPTSLEAFNWVVDRIRTLRVLVLVTFRPEFQAPWIGRHYVTALTINRLTTGEVTAMIGLIVGNRRIPASIQQEIIERTDGIPLFVEEMTKAVLEVGGEGAVQHTVAAVPPPVLAVPASLHASLMARLDRLGPAKEVAQIGAVIGREFSHAELAAVARKPEAMLRSALDRLIQAGLLFRTGIPPQSTYLFKHSLVRDAAYGTLLREPRRALHARIAETLEAQFADIAESQPEMLARHCTEAGLLEKSANQWGKAGQRSLERSALVEGVEQLTRALDQITTLPGTPALRREQIKLQVALITPLIHIKGYAAPETKAALERAHLLIEQAEELGEPLEDGLLLFSVLYGFWVANFSAFNGEVCRDLAAHFLALAEKQRTAIPLMLGHRLVGASLLYTGAIAEGREHFDRAMALYDPAEHRSLATRFGVDAAVAVLSHRSYALWSLGYPEAARADTDQALREAREIRQAATLMYAMAHALFTYFQRGDFATTSAVADELVALADEKGASFWKTGAMAAQGCLFAMTGKASDAIQILISVTNALRLTGTTVFSPFHFAILAKAHAEIGESEDAWRYIGDALTTLETTKETLCEAEILRIAGVIALSSPEGATKAEAYFERALAVARTQQAKSWELRAALSMARLWRDQGKREQARDLLAPVYAWFTEGFDTPDLKEARALLDAPGS
jgi:class 3 adenylate cyclase/tetratricopeptide (TPR) repeat protein